jgi:glycosyltransferase involved in cell wall biosynthesis
MRLSVLIPCYNAARDLAEALTSVFDQIPEPFEVIVVDDGSTDGSPQVARQFGDRVSCHGQDNRGIGAARNRCLSLARGDLIAFLDADDVWPRDSVAARLRCLDADASADSVFGLVEQFISPELPDAMRQALVCPAGAQAARVAGAMLIRRRVFDRVGPFHEGLRVGETIDWVARAEAQGVAMRQVDQVVLRRRLHDTNTGATNRQQRADYARALRASIQRRRADAAGQSTPS